MQKLLKIQILEELESFVLRIWSRTEHLTNCFYSDLLIKLPPLSWGLGLTLLKILILQGALKNFCFSRLKLGFAIQGYQTTPLTHTCGSPFMLLSLHDKGYIWRREILCREADMCRFIHLYLYFMQEWVSVLLSLPSSVSAWSSEQCD